MVPLEFCTFEQERTTLDLALGIALMLVATSLSLAVLHDLTQRVVGSKGLLASGETQPGAFKGRSASVTAFVLLLPTLLILAVFLYYPMLETFRLSTLLARLGAPRSAFICLDNFTRLMTNTGYINSVVISFTLAIAIVILSLSLSLLIATMAYQPIRGGSIYRTLLVWPYALSPVIAGIIFRLMFNPTAGVLNHILDSLFGIRVPWLLDPAIAPWTVILSSTWNIMGFCILFYIAGLQSVPKDLEEAAAIDGANVFQRFFRITFPLLSPITFFLVVTTTTYAFFDTFGLIDFLTGGGPVNSTSTMMYEVYVVGVQARDLGKAASQSLVLFLVVIGVTILQFRASRGRVSYGA
ncbi:MAG: glycerol-3-phosphate ABC transporter permease [Anaerolineaceae bacterium]|nr:glycerol-3-phosphate ABC transporter permease [Anaerolineaceae bacterium]